MNKFLTKIGVAFVGIAMAIGVGVAVGGSDKPKMAEATTCSVSISSYATANSWSNGTRYTTVNIDSNITATAFNSSGSNTGKYYTNGNNWRFYNSETGGITISAKTGYTLSSVTFTYTVSSSGCLHTSSAKSVSAAYSSGTEISLGGVSSFTAYVANTNNATNGQVLITNISVTYDSTGTPAITVNSALAGYTGTNTSLAYTNANLTGVMSVVSSNTTCVTVETPTNTGNGSGTVQVNFLAAGSSTLSFKDGATQLATCSVSVTASSVTITGLPSTASAFVGFTLDLGSTITKTAVGIYSDDVTWVSGTTSIATVDADGVVTGVSIGSSVITVTSDDYPSATMSCTVTVSNPDTFKKITSTDGLTAGALYLIGNEAGSAFMSKTQNANNRGVQSATPSAGVVPFTSGMELITLGGSEDEWTLYANKSDTTGYLYAAGSSSNNYLRTQASNNSNGEWEITFTAGVASVVAQGTSTNNTMRYNSSSSLFACYGSATQDPVALYKVQLSSVTTSGQTTSFTAGNTFSYGGTLTAHYDAAGDYAPTVTPTSYHLDSEDGTEITTSTVLTKASHDGHKIYVVYTDNGVTKSAYYTITVNYAAVTSVVIDTHSASMELGSSYSVSSIGVTVNSQYANQGYEWILQSKTGATDATFSSPTLSSGSVEGTVTLRCRSTADNTKYDELVVTISADPTADFDDSSLSGFVGKDKAIGFTYNNISNSNASKIEVASSDTSKVTVEDDLLAEDGIGIVTINFVAAGSTSLTISYDGGSALDTISVTVSSDYVASVDWSASDFDVYSGATLTAAIDSTWLVNYEMASGDADFVEYGDYTIKLGGSTISLPHTWAVADDGKTLCVEYGGVSSTTVSVRVTQTLNAINKNTYSSGSDDALTFAAACGGSGTSAGSKSWTVTSDAAESSFDNSRGIHYGTGSVAVSYLTLTSTAYTSNYITKVVVNASGASDTNAGLTVTVNGIAYTCDESASVSLTGTATSYTFVGEAAAGTIIVSMAQSSAKKGLYCKSVTVTTSTITGSTNIANSASHIDAQRAVVKFAKAFNAAMDTTSGCTTNMSSAWATATAAWATFNTDISSLSAAEKTYAKNLIKYANATWTADTDSNYAYCLERAMKTYEVCVNDHDMTAFMSTVRPIAASRVVLPTTGNPISGSDASTTIIVVIISLAGAAAIGGYFFLRRRKED